MIKVYSRRQLMAFRPYDAELDYIECTGTQYINTNILVEPLSDGYQYGIMFINDLVDTRTIAGLWQYSFNANNLAFLVNGNYMGIYYGFPKNWRGGEASYARLGNLNEKTEVSVINIGDYDGSSMTMRVTSPLLNTDVVFDNPYTTKAVYPFVIGGVYSGPSPGSVVERAHIRIYYFKLMRYSTPIFDAIPVRVGQVGYLYDRVSNQLFGNAGTGDFILGPDKV